MNPEAAFYGKVSHPTVSFVAVSHETSWFWSTTIAYTVVGVVPTFLVLAGLSRLIQALAS